MDVERAVQMDLCRRKNSTQHPLCSAFLPPPDPRVWRPASGCRGGLPVFRARVSLPSGKFCGGCPSAQLVPATATPFFGEIHRYIERVVYS